MSYIDDDKDYSIPLEQREDHNKSNEKEQGKEILLQRMQFVNSSNHLQLSLQLKWHRSAIPKSLYVDKDYTVALFELLSKFPLADITSILAVVLIFLLIVMSKNIKTTANMLVISANGNFDSNSNKATV
jgi:hypothetical protein